MFNINIWSLACPYLILFICLVSALKQNILYSLLPMAAFALVRVSLINGVEVYMQANFTYMHLCNGRANYSIYTNMCVKYYLL